MDVKNHNIMLNPDIFFAYKAEIATMILVLK